MAVGPAATLDTRPWRMTDASVVGFAVRTWCGIAGSKSLNKAVEALSTCTDDLTCSKLGGLCSRVQVS